MAEEPTITKEDMARKYLYYKAPEFEGNAEEEIEKFKTALRERVDAVDNQGLIFLPNFRPIETDNPTTNSVYNSTTGTYTDEIVHNYSYKKSSIELTTVSASQTGSKSVTIYKVNKPGFFYYQHWKNYWDPSGYIQILVCKSANFKSSPVFELMNSKDTSGKHNDHVNNMFGIRPGSSTYVMIVSNIDTAKKRLYFVPAYGLTDTEMNNSSAIISSSSKTVTLPVSITQKTSALDSDFISCFE